MLAHLFYSKYNESKDQCSCLRCALWCSSYYILHLEERNKKSIRGYEEKNRRWDRTRCISSVIWYFCYLLVSVFLPLVKDLVVMYLLCNSWKRLSYINQLCCRHILGKKPEAKSCWSLLNTYSLNTLPLRNLKSEWSVPMQ